LSETLRELHFSKYLNPDYIARIQEEYKFQDSLTIEKFIMDFELFYHLQEVIPDCIVRGGMAVPFHLSDKKIRRLSVDIDVVTKASQVDIVRAMGMVGKKLNRFINMPDSTHKPRRSTKNLPLLTYYIPYISVLGVKDAEIKVEVWHEFNKPMTTKKIEQGFDLFSFETDFPIVIFDKGSLIGDKITTLALNSIGVPSKRYGDIPKHIYDISSLLKISELEDLKAVKLAFDLICEYENTFFTDGRSFTAERIIDDIIKSLDGFLTIQAGYKLTNAQRSLYGSFNATLLGQGYGSPLSYINNILLVKLLAVYLQSVIKNIMSIDDFTSSLYSDLRSLKSLQSSDATERKKSHKEIMASLKPGNNYAFAKRLPVEQALMYSRIKQLQQ
jgi:hypothetical protein